MYSTLYRPTFWSAYCLLTAFFSRYLFLHTVTCPCSRTDVSCVIVICYSGRLQARSLWARSSMSSITEQKLHLCMPARRFRAHKGSQVSQQDDRYVTLSITTVRAPVIIKLPLCLTTHYALRYMGKWRDSSTYINLSVLKRWVVRFRLRPLYFRGKGHWYPLDRRLGALVGEEKNPLLLSLIEGQPSRPWWTHHTEQKQHENKYVDLQMS
jgi:hypothetical protein